MNSKSPGSSNTAPRVAILFAGGPAPAANAVISSASKAFMGAGWTVIGLLNGYQHLVDFDTRQPLERDRHYRLLDEWDLRNLRNRRGVLIGTARSNPGKAIRNPSDLDDPVRCAGLNRVHQALCSLGIEALVSIGGDDTLKTANLLYEYQRRLPDDARRFRIVHVPKTIDNDYHGIDFTFGFFTAVDVMAKEVLNLNADAAATQSWFIVETMGRKSGWLSYGVGIASEAHLVIGVEDLDSSLCSPDDAGQQRVDLNKLADRIVDLMQLREQRDDKHYGVVVLAEGVAEHLHPSHTADIDRDEHGHLSLGRINMGRFIAERVAERYQERSGLERKVKGVQLGYESRCAPAHAFDVILGSQLGVGAYRGLVEEQRNGHMVSVTGQLDLRYVPFAELINPQTLRTELRYIKKGSDFHRLARFLETQMDSLPTWRGDNQDG
ncbi:MAG: 6-phosphofructokinase [Rickettsiales bacterium]|nr:6-phosphofructokinase [Rickettsiales bacterium]|tara:strand:+ start:254 stop:1564 length:1311 start_codon:yes stop_codon:yes gene_type:complete